MQRSKNSDGLSDKDREQRVQDLMTKYGFDRDKAEFIVSIGAGETKGDLVNLDDEQVNDSAK